MYHWGAYDGKGGGGRARAKGGLRRRVGGGGMIGVKSMGMVSGQIS